MCRLTRKDFWLRSDQIPVDGAKAIDIAVEYRIVNCSILQNPPYCVERFDFYMNQSDQYIADAAYYTSPISNRSTYKMVDVMESHSGERTTKTTRVLVKGKYVFLAFLNYGACSLIYSAKITYNVCPYKTFDSLVSVAKTTAPANNLETIRVEGHCIEHTEKVPGSFYVECESNGAWNTSCLKGRCVCKENMENVGKKCKGMCIYCI